MHPAWPASSVCPSRTGRAARRPPTLLLLDQVCEAVGARVFLSTASTTPVRTPSVAVIHGLQPSTSGHEPGAPGRQRLEAEAAILHARRRICVSADERAMLARAAPDLSEDRVSLVAHGADPLLFRPRDPSEFTPLAQRVGVSRDFVVIVDDAFTDPTPRLDLAETPGFGGLDLDLPDRRASRCRRRRRAGPRHGFAPSADELSLLLANAAAIAIAPNVAMLPLWADAALKRRCPPLLHGPSTDPKPWGASATFVEGGCSLPRS